MEIAEIKSTLRLAQVLAHYNLTPDRNNRLLCPWHNDKTPSLQIYPKTDTWTCFSSKCDAGSGDQIEFIQKKENLTKHEALNKAKYLIDPNYEQKPTITKAAILAKYYQSTLHAFSRSPKARAYAKDRAINPNGIGFSGYATGKSWDKEIYTTAEKLGLFKLKNVLIFPTKNQHNQIASFYGRSITESKTSRHFYLQGGFKGLYPEYPKATTKQLILTESIIDAATIQTHLPQATVLAQYGTNGFTSEHETAIKNLPDLQEIILFYDGDEAGETAAKKINEKLKSIRQNLKITKVETPQGEDINSLAMNHPDTASELLKDLIKNRITISQEVQEAKTGQLDTTNTELITYTTDELKITILGGIKITGLDRMKVTLKIENQTIRSLPVRHSLDLYHSKQVDGLTQKMAETLQISTPKATKIISQLTGELERYRQQKLEELKPKKKEVKQLTQSERKTAVKYLKDKNLIRNTQRDLKKAGIVGEETNALIALLTYTSRKQEKPLHVMFLGASGTGKTYLQEKVSELIPEDEKLEITSLSDNALYYFGREELKNKLILIEDLDGAENVLYPLRELQTKRRISKTVTLKDNKGNLKTITLKVEGPVCVSGCTTREKLYEDNANRAILLYIDGSKKQDARIMNYQKLTSSGALNTYQEGQIKSILQHTQKLLQPIKIVNPYAREIHLPQEVFKPRRTLLLLLSFIEIITFYHQYQRPKKTNKETGEVYIEATLEDIKTAFELMREVLFSKSDELTKATRKFLEMLKKHIQKDETFNTQNIRQKLRMNASNLKRYIFELQRYGYIQTQGGNRYRGFEYQIKNYGEYDDLQNSIKQQLNAILLRIKGLSGPVDQSGPLAKMDHSSP